VCACRRRPRRPGEAPRRRPDVRVRGRAGDVGDAAAGRDGEAGTRALMLFLPPAAPSALLTSCHPVQPCPVMREPLICGCVYILHATYRVQRCCCAFRFLRPDVNIHSFIFPWKRREIERPQYRRLCTLLGAAANQSPRGVQFHF
jgi:hypothetical protein